MAVSGTDLGDYAKKFLGLKYVWGGNSLKTGVDCSGLVQQVFKHFGINVSRTTYTQIGEGKAVSLKGLRAGDLVFFDTNKNVKGADHVGIYLGGGKMVHTPRPGKSVEVVSITSGYYMDRFMAGRRISGVSSVGAKDSDFASEEEARKQMTPEELASSYGWAYGFLNSNKELKGLFNKAVDGSWTPDKFQAELRDTSWWKKTSDTRRQAQVTKTTDPATWKATIDAAKVQVQMLAAEIGAAIPSSKLNTIATTMVETGMDENELRYALGQYVTFTKEGLFQGEAAMHEYTMKQYAREMGVSISDETIKNQAQRIVRKIATTQDFQDELRQNAKDMYPAYADQIDAGITIKDIAGPYIQMMENELELPEASISVMNPLVKRALNGLDANGKPGGVPLYTFQSQLRSDPRWKQTSSAQDNVMKIGTDVLKSMGLIQSTEQ